jgi:26S proteasome regulatory subunit T6
MPSLPSAIPHATAANGKAAGLTSYFSSKIEAAEQLIHTKSQDLRRLEAQRNALNARVRLLREELQLLQEPGSYVGEVVKVMGKKKVLVKVQPEGKYGPSPPPLLIASLPLTTGFVLRSRRLCQQHRCHSADAQSPRRPAV